MKNFLSRRVAFYTTLLVLFSVAGLCGRFHWVLDLFAHFRWQFLVVALLLLGFCVLFEREKSRRIYLWINALVVLWHGGGLYLTGNIIDQPSWNPDLRVVSLNVLTSNTQYDDTLEWLQQQDADIIFLCEVNEYWADAMSPLTDTHPHFVTPTREDNFGMALYSRLPLSKIEVLYPVDPDLPMIHFVLEKSGIGCCAVHPPPPIGERMAGLRNRQLDWVAKFAAREKFWVMGDLNASPWCHGMSKLKNDSELDFRAVNRPIWPTWGRGRLGGLCSIPIDHALCTKDLMFSRYDIGPNIGSDHRGLVLEISRLR